MNDVKKMLNTGFYEDCLVDTSMYTREIGRIVKGSHIEKVGDNEEMNVVYGIFKSFTNDLLVILKIKGIDKATILGKATYIKVARKRNDKYNEIWCKVINVRNTDRIIYYGNGKKEYREIEGMFWTDLCGEDVELYSFIMENNQPYIVDGIVTRNSLWTENLERTRRNLSEVKLEEIKRLAELNKR